MHNQIKAAALISGGLDSMLAAKIIMEQGIHVEGLNFNIGFSSIPKEQKCQLNIKLHTIDVIEEFKNIVINPRYGYGANLNPCLDCKIFMVKKALQWIIANNFDFIITGEVVGQRLKSQRKALLPIVAEDSKAHDLLLRPLCAKKLPLSKPEKEGWVDRNKLYNFSGRSRKPQIALAKQFGFEDFPQPAGGCLLTDIKYCAKLKDLWRAKDRATTYAPSSRGLTAGSRFPAFAGNDSEQLQSCKDYSRDEIELLKIGRHIRPKPNFKMIIGRKQTENEILEKYKTKYTYLYCISHLGPLVLIDGYSSSDDLNLAARITARFGKGCHANEAKVQIHPLGGKPYQVNVTPMPAEQVLQEWYI